MHIHFDYHDCGTFVENCASTAKSVYLHSPLMKPKSEFYGNVIEKRNVRPSPFYPKAQMSKMRVCLSNKMLIPLHGKHFDSLHESNLSSTSIYLFLCSSCAIAPAYFIGWCIWCKNPFTFNLLQITGELINDRKLNKKHFASDNLNKKLYQLSFWLRKKLWNDGTQYRNSFNHKNGENSNSLIFVPFPPFAVLLCLCHLNKWIILCTVLDAIAHEKKKVSSCKCKPNTKMDKLCCLKAENVFR